MFGFGKKQQDNEAKKTTTTFVSEREMEEQLAEQKSDMEHAQAMSTSKLVHDHKMELRENEFDLEHFKDEEIKEISDELVESKETVAVLKKENEMLKQITNLNADVIDIKDLVGKLIEKLPEVNLQSLTVHASNGGDK